MQTTRGSDDEKNVERIIMQDQTDGELVPFKFNQIKSHIRAKILSLLVYHHTHSQDNNEIKISCSTVEWVKICRRRLNGENVIWFYIWWLHFFKNDTGNLVHGLCYKITLTN